LFFFEGSEELPYRRWDGLSEFSGAGEHPLAVGCDHILAVDEYPVEAITARHYVLCLGTVVDNEKVVAVSAAEGVLACFAKGAVGDAVVTRTA
jgi:hypothetical protein